MLKNFVGFCIGLLMFVLLIFLMLMFICLIILYAQEQLLAAEERLKLSSFEVGKLKLELEAVKVGYPVYGNGN